jgi:long-subunit acyl-CoA synthetase (AMP-forming)
MRITCTLYYTRKLLLPLATISMLFYSTDSLNICDAIVLALLFDYKQQKAIVKDLKRIGKDRRGYEQIQEVIVRLEPFTIASGLMTQTLKVSYNLSLITIM